MNYGASYIINSPEDLRPLPAQRSSEEEAVAVYSSPRCDDGERDAAAARLREHHATGRLSQEEFDARMQACMKAKTTEQLVYLTKDLPGPTMPHVPLRQQLRGHWLPWKAMTAMQRLVVFICTTALGLMTMIIPAVLVAGASHTPAYIGVPVGWGGGILGLMTIVLSLVGAFNDPKIHQRWS